MKYKTPVYKRVIRILFFSNGGIVKKLLMTITCLLFAISENLGIFYHYVCDFFASVLKNSQILERWAACSDFLEIGTVGCPTFQNLASPF